MQTTMDTSRPQLPEYIEKYLYGDNVIAKTLESIEVKIKIKRHIIAYGNFMNCLMKHFINYGFVFYKELSVF